MQHPVYYRLIITLFILVVTLSMVGIGVAQTPDHPESAPSLSSPPIQTVYQPLAPAKPDAVLWNQPLSAVDQLAYVDQEFTDRPVDSSFLADDFTNADPWLINKIFVPGSLWNGPPPLSLLNASQLTWQIFADAGGVPDGDPNGGGNPPLRSLTLVPADPMVTITNGSGGMPSNTTLNLTEPVYLPEGTYWFIFYPTGPYVPFGQYGRQPADTTNGYAGQFINPENGFGFGTAWQDWAVTGTALHDQAFRLEGRSALGTLEGTVSSLGYCDANPVPVQDTEVLITSSTGTTVTVMTDGNGHYFSLLNEVEGPYSVTVAYPEHAGGEETGIAITGGETTTVNIGLRWLKPCVSAAPSNFNVVVGADYSYSRLLGLHNRGAAASAFQVEEAGGADFPWLSESPVTGMIAADSVSGVFVTFDSMTYTVGTQLTATLNIPNDDPFNSVIHVPITMTIAVPALGVDIGSDQTLTGLPLQTVTFPVTVVNTSNGPSDSFDITLSGNSWMTTASITETGSLDAWESETFDVMVAIPATAKVGDTDAVVVTANSQTEPGVSDAITLTTTSTGEFALSLEPAADSLSGASGETVTYTLALTNLGITTTVEVTAAGNLWDVQLPVTSFDLGINEVLDVEVQVTIPVGAEVGESDSVSITATGLGGVTDSSVLTTTSLGEFAIGLEPAVDTRIGAAGETIAYQLTLTNLGEATPVEIVALGNTWDALLPISSFDLAAGAFVDVEVHVTIAADAQNGDVDEVMIVATGLGSSFASSVLTTTAQSRGVYLPLVVDGHTQ